MSDELGRGQVGWPAERWQALDTLAAETVTSHVVLRNLVDHQEAAGTFTVRIAGKNINVETICSKDFDFDMAKEDDEDLKRKVRLAAQQLATAEDTRVLQEMKPKKANRSPLGYAAFSEAKGELGKQGVQHGFGAVTSPSVMTTLEIETAGLRTGLQIVEQLLNTKVAQCSALPIDKIEAVVLQASPAAYRLVHASGARLRVLGLTGGKNVKLQLEELIAVAELEPNRCAGIGTVDR
jgi:uncharacterized linocin/CFP29 family protein